MSPRPDQPDDLPPDPNDGTSPATPAGRAAERIIEKFGGIRPMAHKLEVPVTTVQGWKKRGAIPTARHADLLAAARRHEIEIDPAELAAAAPNDEAASEAHAEPRPAEPAAGAPVGTVPVQGESEGTGPARIYDADAASDGTAGRNGMPGDDAPATAGNADTPAARPAETAPRTAPPAVVERRSGGRGLAAFATVLSLLALGTALSAPWWVPDLLEPRFGQPPQAAALEERIGALETQLREVSGREVPDLSGAEQRIASLEQAVDGLRQQGAGQPAVAPGGGNGDLAQRIAQLEQRQQAPQGADLDPLRQRLDQLAQELSRTTEQIARLSEQTQQAQGIADAQRRNTEAIAALETEANRLASEISAASERAATAAEAVSRRDTADAETQALVLAAGQLRSALQGSGDFADELQAVRQLGGADPQIRQTLESISSRADSGVPTATQLASRFERMASDIVRAGQQEGEQPWYEKAANRVTSLVTVRRVAGEVEGNSAAAIVSRAEARLDENDLEGAVAQVEMLAGPAAETAAPWLRDARARLAADAAVAALTRQAISRLAGVEPQAAPQDGATSQDGVVTQ